MARGFESKAVESQQAEQQISKREPLLTDEERELRKKRESLESSKRGLKAELEKATSERRRADLGHSIAYIEGELKKLG